MGGVIGSVLFLCLGEWYDCDLSGSFGEEILLGREEEKGEMTLEICVY